MIECKVGKAHSIVCTEQSNARGVNPLTYMRLQVRRRVEVCRRGIRWCARVIIFKITTVNDGIHAWLIPISIFLSRVASGEAMQVYIRFVTYTSGSLTYTSRARAYTPESAWGTRVYLRFLEGIPFAAQRIPRVRERIPRKAEGEREYTSV